MARRTEVIGPQAAALGAARGDFTMRMEIRGLEETQRKMEQVARDLAGVPMYRAITTATLLVQRTARLEAPMHTGRLRASITPQVRTLGPVVQGVVSSNLVYAAAVELGSRPHWAPIAPLLRWVHLKRLAATPGEERGIAYAIQRKIARFGTRAQPYLQPAFEKNVERIKNLINTTVARIVAK